MEAVGRGGSVAEATNGSRNLNIKGLSAMDLRANKANGEPWEPSKLSDRQKARKEIMDKKQTWLIGSPRAPRSVSL